MALARRARARMISGLRALDREPDSIAATEAKCSNAFLDVAPLHFIKQRDQDASAARADRVAEGDRSAVHVDLVEVQTEFAGDGNRGHLESLVDLVQIYFVFAPSGLFPEQSDGVDGRHHDPRRIY